MAAKPTDAQLLALAQQRYPLLSAFLANPEIRRVLLIAVDKGWGTAEIEGELRKTTWWKSTSASMREWDALKVNDPATYNQRVRDTRVALGDQARALGVTLSGAQIDDLMLKVNRLGWSADQVKDAMAAQFKVTSAPLTGTGGGVVASLRQKATEYLVPMSDATLQQWTQQLLSGDQTEETFTAYLQEQAASLFPSLANVIKSGVSVRQYVQPYYEIAAKNLGLNPASIDPMEAKWLAPLQQRDEKGQQVAMTLAEWDRELKTNSVYGYDTSQNGVAEAASFAGRLQQMFGAA